MKNALLRALHLQMGKAGILEYVEVAERAELDPRAVRGLSENTRIGTLAKIAAALDCSVKDLVHDGAPRGPAPTVAPRRVRCGLCGGVFDPNPVWDVSHNPVPHLDPEGTPCRGSEHPGVPVRGEE